MFYVQLQGVDDGEPAQKLGEDGHSVTMRFIYNDVSLPIAIGSYTPISNTTAATHLLYRKGNNISDQHVFRK